MMACDECETLFDWFNVYLNGKWIDKVPYVKGNWTSDEVRQSLINHDGYDSRIIVTRTR